jgi:hypothetical protein
MEICSGTRDNSHEEIIYDRGSCPLCTALEEIKSLEAEIEKLNNQE